MQYHKYLMANSIDIAILFLEHSINFMLWTWVRVNLFLTATTKKTEIILHHWFIMHYHTLSQLVTTISWGRVLYESLIAPQLVEKNFQSWKLITTFATANPKWNLCFLNTMIMEPGLLDCCEVLHSPATQL
jgi:hypothetical protein